MKKETLAVHPLRSFKRARAVIQCQQRNAFKIRNNHAYYLHPSILHTLTYMLIEVAFQNSIAFLQNPTKTHCKTINFISNTLTIALEMEPLMTYDVSV